MRFIRLSMKQSITRRGFLGQFVGAGAALAGATWIGPSVVQAVAPIERPGAARLLLSLAAYSFRDDFQDSNHHQTPTGAKPLDLFQFIDYCAEHGCAGAELTSYYFPPHFTKDFLLQLKRHAFLRGI